VRRCAWCSGENGREKSVTCCDNCARSWRRVRAKRGRLYAPSISREPAPKREAPRTVAELLAKLEAQVAELERVVALKARIKDMKQQLGLFGDNT